jgi:hypothetical protein
LNWFLNFIRRNRSDPSAAKGWKLSNAEKERDSDPRGFSIPRSEQRRGRKPQDVVRIRFESTEQLPNSHTIVDFAWVEITAVQRGLYKGVLKEGLIVLSHPKGQEFTFAPENIFAVRLPPEYSLPYQQIVHVSPAVFDRDEWPALLFKNKPESAEDSGWRVVTKSERPSSATLQIKGYEVIQKFQALDAVLDEPGFFDWYWCETQLEYRRYEA